LNTSVSGVSNAETTFQYVYLSEPGQLIVWSRVSTSCGTASGAVAFERVGEP
jgi:hypothetical protein